jgi:hypothetical protein
MWVRLFPVDEIGYRTIPLFSVYNPVKDRIEKWICEYCHDIMEYTCYDKELIRIGTEVFTGRFKGTKVRRKNLIGGHFYARKH